MTCPRPRTRGVLPLAAVAALVLGLLTAAPAHAATFQFWGYYQLTDGAWVFAQKGSGETNPADGSVEGWRWAITDESGTPPRTPRVTPTFGQVCDATDAQSGMKRVAVVLDYGRAVDGRRGPGGRRGGAQRHHRTRLRHQRLSGDRLRRRRRLAH